MEPDLLPPTEYLLMEVLAARVRLGEACWTFPSRLAPTVRSLAAKGYVTSKTGVVDGTVMVWPTPDGEAAFLSPDYVAPDAR